MLLLPFNTSVLLCIPNMQALRFMCLCEHIPSRAESSVACVQDYSARRHALHRSMSNFHIIFPMLRSMKRQNFVDLKYKALLPTASPSSSSHQLILSPIKNGRSTLHVPAFLFPETSNQDWTISASKKRRLSSVMVCFWTDHKTAT